jgi:putative addiction module component (TIGR02574 family)
MTIQNQAIFDAALALPEAERALLVERLFDSLSPEPGELTDDEFYAELERRRAEVEQGLTKPVPWSEVYLLGFRRG